MACKVSSRFDLLLFSIHGSSSHQSIDLNLLDVADHEGIEVSDLLHVVHDHHPHVNDVRHTPFLSALGLMFLSLSL
jgi:hypothetical protein